MSKAEDILQAAGFHFLKPGNGVATFEAVLERLAKELKGAELLTFELCREHAISALKEAGAKNAAAITDAAIGKARIEKTKKKLQGRDIEFEILEPWAGRVNGAELLDACEERCKRHLVMTPAQRVIVCLWALLTWVHHLFIVSPGLYVTAPTMSSGKSRVLEILFCLCKMARYWIDPSPAIVYRFSDKYPGLTLLMDEADNGIAHKRELRAILNAGFNRGVRVPRCVGDDHEPREFDLFTPRALAGIGKLHATTMDRSLIINMKRKKEGETVESLDIVAARDDLKDWRRQASKWAEDNAEALRSWRGKVPGEDRRRDMWAVMLAIAWTAGGGWPEKAMEAAKETLGENRIQEQSVMLLEDVRKVFSVLDKDRLHSATIAAQLGKLEGRPWADCSPSGKRITVNQLAAKLEPFGIHPGQLWIEGNNRNGYKSEDFAEAFERYLRCYAK